MSQVTLHGVPASPCVRAAAMGIIVEGLIFRMCVWGPIEFRSAAYRKRHPFGKVASFVHDQLELYETQATLRYLEWINPEPSFAPRDPSAEARMIQLCGTADFYVMAYVSVGVLGNSFADLSLAAHLSFFTAALESEAV